MVASAPRDLPSWSPGPALPAGLARGVLRWDGDCVRLEADDGPVYAVIWPVGTRLREDLIPPMVVDGHDRVIGLLGDLISLPGAPFPPGAWADQQDRLVVDLPQRCRGEALWFGVPIGP